MKIIDLHTHSSKSDGTLSPTALASLAKSAGLAAIALTDHDTADGLFLAQEKGKELNLEVIAGIELAAEYLGGEIHILGYFIDYKGQYFKQSIEALAEIRSNRNSRLLERLNAIGVKLSETDVAAEAGGKTITRLHFARAMHKKGYVKSLGEAFERYLDSGRPAFVGRNSFEYGECIDIIHKSGGVASLAHPFIYRHIGDNVPEMLERLKSVGLNAVEALYPLHGKKQTDTLLRLAAKLGLKITGGSDFHGDNKPNIKIGTGLDNLRIGYEVLEALRNDL